MVNRSNSENASALTMKPNRDKESSQSKYGFLKRQVFLVSALRLTAIADMGLHATNRRRLTSD
jgi:hypothetical protein